LILGGAVKGGRFYGTAPVIANNGPDDVGQGRPLPSTSVDQYAATQGQWFGISDTGLLTVLPNLGRWDVGVRGVGGGGWGLCDAIEAVFLLVARRQPF
jgi:hypothetical protein